MKQLTLFVILLTLLLQPLAVQADDKLKVVATTTQAYDLVQIIAQDRVELTGLMGGGIDPHLYKPTEADIRAMNEANMVIYSGLHLEGQFTEIFENIAEQDVRTYALATLVEREGFVLPSQNDLAVPDPHFWFDPRNWQLATEGLVQVLSEEDPANAEFYAANGATFQAQLELVYNWGVEAMSLIPEEQRVLVTSHDAFQYFGDAFGWDVRGLQGISTADEAGVGDVQALADFVVEQQIPVLFVESSVSPRTIESVQEAADNAGWSVAIGGELYSDAMGTIGTFGGTYIGMIGENITTVVTAYGYGDGLPEWPKGLPTPDEYEVVEAE